MIHCGDDYNHTLCGVEPPEHFRLDTSTYESEFTCSECRVVWTYRIRKWVDAGDPCAGYGNDWFAKHLRRVADAHAAELRAVANAEKRQREREAREANFSYEISPPDPHSYVGMTADYADIPNGMYDAALVWLENDCATVDCDDFEEALRLRRSTATRPPPGFWFKRWLFQNGFID